MADCALPRRVVIARRDAARREIAAADEANLWIVDDNIAAEVGPVAVHTAECRGKSAALEDRVRIGGYLDRRNSDLVGLVEPILGYEVNRTGTGGADCYDDDSQT